MNFQTTILEGKYWKRRAEAVIAEYKKWRMFHIMRLFGKGDTSVQDTVRYFLLLFINISIFKEIFVPTNKELHIKRNFKTLTYSPIIDFK